MSLIDNEVARIRRELAAHRRAPEGQRRREEALRLWRDEHLSHRAIQAQLHMSSKYLRALLHDVLGEAAYHVIASEHHGNNQYGSPGKIRVQKVKKEKPVKSVAAIEPLDDWEDEPEEPELPVGRCLRCGLAFTEAASTLPPRDGVCGGCQEIDARLARRRETGNGSPT